MGKLTFADAEAAFPNRINTPTGFKVPCIGHSGDREASLFIDRGDKQPFVTKCFGGCTNIHKTVVEHIQAHKELSWCPRLDSEPITDSTRNAIAKVRSARGAFTASAETLRSMGVREYRGNVGFPFMLDGKLRNMHVGLPKAGYKPKWQGGRNKTGDCLFNIETVNPFEPCIISEGEQDAACAVEHGFVGVSLLCGGQKVIATEFLEKLSHATAIYFAADNDDKVGPASIRNLAGVVPEGTKLLDLSKASVKAKDFCALRHALGDGEKFKAEVQRLMGIAEPLQRPQSGLIVMTERVPPKTVGARIVDMPESVLGNGPLAELYHERMKPYGLPTAYAASALITIAGAQCPWTTAYPPTLNSALVGEVGTGKTTAIELAATLMGVVGSEVWCPLKAGSFEGLATSKGNAGGAARVVFPDELSHLLNKAGIENSSFMANLQTAFYRREFDLVIAKGKEVPFNAALSIIGGAVESEFGTLLGRTATGGFYDRLLLAQAPAGFAYDYRDFEHEAHAEGNLPTASTIAINTPELAELRKQWRKELKAPGRWDEIALRVARIVLARDGRTHMSAKDAEPWFDFAKYQVALRQTLKPNTGLTTSGKVTSTILAHLLRNAPDGSWVNVRQMNRQTHIMDYGPDVVERTMSSLQAAGEVEIKQVAAAGRGGRPSRNIRLLTDDLEKAA